MNQFMRHTRRRVLSLGWQDPLEEGMTTHSRIFAWRVPWTEYGGLQSIGLQKAGYNLRNLAHMHDDKGH